MIISLTPITGTALNIVSILSIHLIGSWVCLRIPKKWFLKNNNLFYHFQWEENTQLYSMLKIKRWKEYLPDGSKLFKHGFQKKRLKEKNEAYFYSFIMETKRAELTHFVTFFPLCFFFIWNPVEAYLAILLYGVLANLPCILVQRYNRMRFNKVLGRFIQKKKRYRNNSPTRNTSNFN
ncbi:MULTISPECIES: glycosyl-4,4'-diaponeurosporenoate acyltransferase CrtO family protein [Bacillus]|uniref:glycosyl-4,4'-diaponeurosporenoate acyltransferase CrtO family protein n=1 Tax=Bacillus TaxID=1386 RepID=UPI000BB897EE|nr:MULTISPECIES: glycosyl-4,4'-diaponeurosporenoate acyltransferase [Bacillus]